MKRGCLGRKGVFGGEKRCLDVKRGLGVIMGVFRVQMAFFRANRCVGVKKGVRVYWGVWGPNGVV